jgi:hypothetical protein
MYSEKSEYQTPRLEPQPNYVPLTGLSLPIKSTTDLAEPLDFLEEQQ